MAITLTEKAAEEVRRAMEQQKLDEGYFVRFGVTGGGCSGFSYMLGFDDKYDEESDFKYDHFGVSVVVDKKSDLYVDGTKIDFYEGLDKRGFFYDNPNQVKSCGCGQSFQA